MLKDKKVIIFILLLMLLIYIPLSDIFYTLNSTMINYDRVQKNADSAIEVKYNDIITESFYSDKNQLFAIELMVDSKDSTNIEYGIKDYKSSQLLYKNQVNIPGGQNKAYYQFVIPDIKDSKNNNYVFYIKNLESKEGLKIWKSDNNAYDKGDLEVNGNKEAGDLYFKTAFHAKYPFIYKVFFGIFILALTSLLILFITKKYFVSLEKSFLILALVFGVFMTFFVPPAQAPDEIVHFFRAYEVSQGDFIPSEGEYGIGSYMPEGIWNFIKVGNYELIPTKYNEKVDIDDFMASSKFNVDSNKTKFIDVGGASIYMPIQYLPQDIGIFIGRIFNCSVITIFYLARLTNMLVWLMLSYLALKIIPVGKRILFLVALMPMVVQQAASNSPDGLLMGISFLFTAYCLHLAYVKEKVNKVDIIKIIVMALIIISIKFIYMPMILMVVLIGSKKLGGRKKLIFLAAGMAVAGILINILWLKQVPFMNAIKTPSPNINSGQQIKFVLSHPLEYIQTLFNTYIQSTRFYIESGIGILGWLDNNLPYPLVYSYVFLIIFNSIANDEKEDVELSNTHKSILLFTAITVMLLIISSLYAAWTDVGAKLVSGVQGRYFIPISICLLVAFVNNKVTIKSRNLHQYLIGYEIWIFAYTIITVITRYYVTIA